MTEKNESCCNFFPAFLKYFNMSAREHGTQGGGGKDCVCVCVCVCVRFTSRITLL